MPTPVPSPITQQRIVSAFRLPVDGMGAIGSYCEFTNIDDFISPTNPLSRSANLFNGMRVLNVDSGVIYKIINTGPNLTTPVWKYSTEEERLVEVLAVSQANIESFSSVSNVSDFGDVNLSFTVGANYLVNAQTTGSENGIYICTTGGTSGVFKKHPEYTSAILEQKTLIYVNSASGNEPFKGHILRVPAGKGRNYSIWEKDDYVNNGLLSKVNSDTDLQVNGGLNVIGAISSESTITGITIKGAVEATTITSSGKATLNSLEVTNASLLKGTLTVQGNTTLANVVAGAWNATPVGLTYGGTGQTTAQAAMNTLAGGVTSATVLRGDGTNVTLGKVVLSSDVSGVLPIASGGTLSNTPLSGTSIMIAKGGKIIQGALGTTTTVLHGNASGDPSYGAVTLTTDVTGVLPVANGGTGSATQNFVDLTSSQTITGAKRFTFITSGYTDGTGSGTKSIDFTLGNVFFWNVSGNTTIAVATTQSELYKYLGGSFCVTIKNGGETSITVTFLDDENLFEGITAGLSNNVVTLTSGASLSYTGLVLGTTGSTISQKLYGVIAPATANLMT